MQDNSKKATFRVPQHVVGAIISEHLAKREGPKICQHIYGKADPKLLQLLNVDAEFHELEGENESFLVVTFSVAPENYNVIPFTGEYREDWSVQTPVDEDADADEHDDFPEPPEPRAM